MASFTMSPGAEGKKQQMLPDEILLMIARAQWDMMQLSVADLDFLYALSSPPKIIKDVMQTVMLLLGREANMTWEGMKRVLTGNSRKTFHRILMSLTYRTDKIKNKAVWRAVCNRFMDPSFHPALVKKGCQEGANLCSWLCAVSSYHLMEQVIKRETGIAHLPDCRYMALKADREARGKKNKTSVSSSPLSPSSAAKSPKKKRRAAGHRQGSKAVPGISADEYLQRAEPIILQTQQACDRLSPQDIDELRSYRNPPLVVKQVMYAVMTLFGRPREQRTWADALDFMAGEDDRFLRVLLRQKERTCRPARLQRFERFLRAREIDALWVRNASKAAANVCDWAQKYAVLARVHAEYIRLYKTSPNKRRGRGGKSAVGEVSTATLDQRYGVEVDAESNVL